MREIQRKEEKPEKKGDEGITRPLNTIASHAPKYRSHSKFANVHNVSPTVASWPFSFITQLLTDTRISIAIRLFSSLL